MYFISASIVQSPDLKQFVQPGSERHGDKLWMDSFQGHQIQRAAKTIGGDAEDVGREVGVVVGDGDPANGRRRSEVACRGEREDAGGRHGRIETANRVGLEHRRLGRRRIDRMPLKLVFLPLGHSVAEMGGDVGEKAFDLGTLHDLMNDIHPISR